MRDYLFYVPGSSFGGLEIQMVKRASDACRKGSHAIVLCVENSRVEKYARELSLETVNIYNIKHYYFNLRAALKITGIMLKHKIMYIVAGSTKQLSIVILAKFFLRIFAGRKAEVVLYQQMQSDIRKKDIVHNMIYKCLDKAVVLTESMKASLIRNTVLEAGKIAVIPYGIELTAFIEEGKNKAENRRHFGLDEKGFIVGYIARIDEHKDQNTAIKAFHEAGIPGASMVFAGAVDRQMEFYYKECTGLLEELNLMGRVKFLPFTNEIPRLMSCFDLFIMPSRSETFGLVIIEALAAGLPVIATNSGGVPEIIEDCQNGMLFEQSDYIRLSELMALLYNNSNLRQKLIDNGLAFAKENYDYGTQSRKFFGFIEKQPIIDII